MAKEGNDLGLEDPLNPNRRDVNLPIHHVVDDRDMPICEHVISILDDLDLGIVRSHVQA